MPSWSPPYLIRRNSRILSFAVKQNHMGLQTLGEACYLLKRQARANATFHFDDRRVSTITKTASAFEADPDTGMLRYNLWTEGVDPIDEYPDQGVFTATVQGSGGITDVWGVAVDKYSFVDGRKEFAFDTFRNQLDSDGNLIDNAVNVVFNTPPFAASNLAVFNFGVISPAADFARMQPDISDETNFYNTLFSYDQWIDLDAVIRSRRAPHRFLVAFPGTATDLVSLEGGFVRETRESFWTSVPNYSPVIVEWDVVVRASNNQRFQVVNYTPIFIENILCSQHFDLAEVDSRSSIYDFKVVTS